MPSPVLGAYAPTVTRYAYDPDADGFEPPRSMRVIAQYPGNAMETDDPTGDVVMADLVLLLLPSQAASEFDEWVATDGLRYRVQGAPARYLNPHTGTAVTQVNLRRIT